MPATQYPRHDTKFSSAEMISNLPFISAVNMNIFARGCSEYKLVETFIHKYLKKKYSAEGKCASPWLISLNYNKRIIAASGIRLAETGPLNLEKYLQYPVEQEIGFFYKTAIKRESIAEMGAVISSWRGNSRSLLILLIYLLYKVKREWLLVLSNSEIEYTLKKIHFNEIPFSDESRNEISREKEQWGRYFNDDAMIMYCHIPSAISILMQKSLTRFSLSLFSRQLNELAEQWKQKSDQ